MEKSWIKNYLPGVPAELVMENVTLVDLFDRICSNYPNNKSITCHGETLLFHEIASKVNAFATSLVGMGFVKGDRIAVALPNLMQYPIVVFAILKIGAVVVNINPLYTAVEMEYLLNDSGATGIVILDLIAKKLNDILPNTSIKHAVVTKVADMYPLLKRVSFGFIIKYIKRSNGDYNYPAHDFRALIQDDKKLIYAPNLCAKDTAFIQYTGATTGRPKGAILAHQNIVANITQIHAWLKAQVPDLDKQVSISALPLYHIFSLTANLFTTFFEGGETIMVPNPREVKDMVKIFKTTKFTIFNGLDTLYSHLLNSEDFVKHKYPSFKYSVAGGMPALQIIAERWCSVTGVMPSNCYGLTEASPAVTMSLFDGTFDGSVGYPLPSTDVEIRDSQTLKQLARGEIGTIWVKGPQVMKAYWNKPEQTSLAFDENGWFNTHDLGYFNEQGKLFISGRETDMIIISGFNVYPIEVENVLATVAEIKEVAVLGTKDGDTGEQVVAFVVFKDGMYLNKDDIVKECRKSLASYKVPHQIIIVDHLPKTLVGKIDKVALVKQFFEKV